MRPRLRPALRMLAASAMTLALALGPAARAQDSTPESTLGPFCALLTAEEASTALGVAVTPAGGSDVDCDWQADFTTGIFTSLNVRADSGTIAEGPKLAFSDGTDLTVSGNTAYYAPDITVLWVEVGGHLLAFQLVGDAGEGIDIQAALTALAEIVVGRIGSISIPVETPVPQPSFVGDPELVGLFPDEIGGQAVQVLSFTGQEIVANASGDSGAAALQAINDALVALGKTIDDVSFGYTLVNSGATSTLIVALRVKGADATAVLPLVLPLFTSEFLSSFSDPQETLTQVAGKDVTMVTDGPPSDTGDKAYLYPKNDVVWLVAVIGTGVAIEDVLGALP